MLLGKPVHGKLVVPQQQTDIDDVAPLSTVAPVARSSELSEVNSDNEDVQTHQGHAPVRRGAWAMGGCSPPRDGH